MAVPPDGVKGHLLLPASIPLHWVSKGSWDSIQHNTEGMLQYLPALGGDHKSGPAAAVNSRRAF